MLADEDVVEAFVRRVEHAGEATMIAWGSSMLPSIWPGSRLRVRALEGRSVELGDVVIARRGGALVAHRVVAFSPGGLVCRGDFFDRLEEPLPESAVVGRVAGLHLGPFRVRLPRRTETALNRVALSGLDAARPLREPALTLARAATRRALESRSLRSARRALLPWHVERLSPQHLSGLRRTLLRRGQRPDRLRMSGWTRSASSALALPTAFVAVDERRLRIVGYVRAQASEDDGVVSLPDLYVERIYRGLGVSSALTRAALSWLERLPVESRPRWIRVDVRPGGPAARTARRFGFVESPAVARRSAEHVPMLLDLEAMK
jgi:GNAT superfamily N-acetyltransferase